MYYFSFFADGSDNIMSVLTGMSPPTKEGINEGKKKKSLVQPKGTICYKVGYSSHSLSAVLTQ